MEVGGPVGFVGLGGEVVIAVGSIISILGMGLLGRSVATKHSDMNGTGKGLRVDHLSGFLLPFLPLRLRDVGLVVELILVVRGEFVYDCGIALDLLRSAGPVGHLVVLVVEAVPMLSRATDR